jgi:Ca2+/H+ antiporter, TMEM165/GDT1 family
MRRRFNERKFFMFVPLVLAGIAVFTGIVMWLWNNVLAVVLHISLISFWQALGLLVLSKILFGGFRGGGGGWGRHKWKSDMIQRWDAMSGEEKEKFRGEWEKRCGRRFGRSFEETKPAENA